MNWNPTVPWKKRKNGFINGLITIICGIITLTPTKEHETGGSHTFNDDTSVFNLTKTKNNSKLKIKNMSEVSTSNKSIFTSANVNHKYGMFEANY